MQSIFSVEDIVFNKLTIPRKVHAISRTYALVAEGKEKASIHRGPT